jgi:hypothetical protein
MEIPFSAFLYKLVKWLTDPGKGLGSLHADHSGEILLKLADRDSIIGNGVL